MKALNIIEKRLGHSINKLDMENLTMEHTAVIMWGGLVHEDAELTPEKVMDLVDEHSNLQSAAEIMGQAFDAAFSGGKNEKKN
jgi:hypothetical protein